MIPPGLIEGAEDYRVVGYALSFAGLFYEFTDSGLKVSNYRTTIKDIGFTEKVFKTISRSVEPGAYLEFLQVDMLIRYDSGWFGKLGRTELNDAGSGNFVRGGDSSFECDAWGTYKVCYSNRNGLVREYPVSYHLAFENISNNPKKEEYKLVSFTALLNIQEEENARRLSSF